MTEFVLLAATLFENTRCCIAGIEVEGAWVRPGFPGERVGSRRGTRLITAEYLWPSDGFIGASLTRLDAQYKPRADRTPPHMEDADLTSRLKAVGHILAEKERINYLQDHSENEALPEVQDERSLARGLTEVGRSLVLVGPVRPTRYQFGNLPGRFGTTKYRTRIEFKIPRQKTSVDLSCTDLKWRAVGRVLGAEERPIEFSGDEIPNLLDVREDVYLALGLTRGDPYALVVGVHTVPDYTTVESAGSRLPISVRQNRL